MVAPLDMKRRARHATYVAPKQSHYVYRYGLLYLCYVQESAGFKKCVP